MRISGGRLHFGLTRQLACHREAIAKGLTPTKHTSAGGYTVGDLSAQRAGRHCYRISAAMLSAIRSAASWTESGAKWA